MDALLSEEDEFSNSPVREFCQGTIVEFLRRNCFKVCLADGLEIIAAMPERLINAVPRFQDLQPGQCLSVNVRMHRAPRMNWIVETAVAERTC